MPKKPKSPCKIPFCPGFAVSGGYCEAHSPLAEQAKTDRRAAANKRGYGAAWRKVRARVLRAAGIPEGQWYLYAVDHNPPYNPDVEPDHEMYTLLPTLIVEHNRKTASKDGGFGNKKKGRGEGQIFGTYTPKPCGKATLYDVCKNPRGSHG